VDDTTNDKFIKTFNDPKVKNIVFRLLRDFQAKHFYLLTWSELVQLGRIAVWKSLLKFDAARNTQFSSYVYRRLKWALIDVARKHRKPNFFTQIQDVAAPQPSVNLIDVDEIARSYLNGVGVISLGRQFNKKPSEIKRHLRKVLS